MTGRLDGKVAIITGGASGIGKATVERFAEEGAKVVIADVQDGPGEALAEAVGADRAAYVHTDVADEGQVKAMVDLAVSRFGRLDCIFNNAGIAGVQGSIEETDVEGYHQSMDVLVLGVILGMKHAVPIMKKQRSGSIINTASVASLRAGLGPFVYSGAKAAVRHLSVAAMPELAAHNIRVNAICPGGIVTSIFADAAGLGRQAAESTYAKLREAFTMFQPIPRAGEGRDIANAALFLASDESSFITGQALTVDGGLTMGRRHEETEAAWEMLADAVGGQIKF